MSTDRTWTRWFAAAPEQVFDALIHTLQDFSAEVDPAGTLGTEVQFSAPVDGEMSRFSARVVAERGGCTLQVSPAVISSVHAPAVVRAGSEGFSELFNTVQARLTD